MVVADPIYYFISRILEESPKLDSYLATTGETNNHGRIAQNGKFMYACPDELEGNENGFMFPLYFMSSVMCTMYMGKQPVKHVYSLFEQDPMKSYERNKNLVTRLLRKLNKSIINTSQIFGGRIYTNTDACSLALIGMPHADDVRMSQYFGVLTYSHEKLSETSIIMIDLNNKDQMIKLYPDTMFYTGPQREAVLKISDRVVHRDIQMKLHQAEMMHLIMQILDLLFEDKDMSTADLPYPVYTDGEISLIRAAASFIHDDKNCYPVNQYTVNGTEPDPIFKQFSKTASNHYMFDNIKELPLIDLNDKEWKYIDNYCAKKQELNLVDAFTSPRYGSDVRIFEEGMELICSFDLDSANDIMRLYISHNIDPSTTAVITVDLKNVSHFKVSNFDSAASVFRCKPEKLPASHVEIERLSPLMRWTSAQIVGFTVSMIDLFVVIHDRPKRTRMLNYTQRVDTKRKGSSKKAEPEFAVSRILKTVDEAKRLVLESDPTHSTRKDAEYTMESWERQAHYRTLKSGRTVYVSASMCQRHLPMSNKELHVKL